MSDARQTLPVTPGVPLMLHRTVKLELRRLTPADLAGVCQIEATVEGERWDRGMHRAWAKGADQVTAVAVMGQRVYGFVSAGVFDKEVLVERLAVAPAVRRSGIARRLLEWVERRCAPAGCELAAVVPERAVDVQLCLRHMGWRCHNYLMWHPGEDGHLLFRKVVK